MTVNTFKATFAAALTATLAACGGGGADPSYTLGGSVSGLASSGLVLAAGGSTKSLAANATSFAFDDSFSGAYDVAVLSQPDGQSCTVSNGRGAGGSNVSNVAVTCRGYVAYVANFLGKSIAQFSIAEQTGQLSALPTATLKTPYLPSGLASPADGSHVWATYQDDATVSSYAAATDGSLTATSAGQAYTAGYGIASSADGAHVYAANYGGSSVSQFNADSNGSLSALSNAPVASGIAPYAVALTPDNSYAYVANVSDNSISEYSIDSQGRWTPLSPATVSTSAFGTKPQALAVDPNGNYLLATLAASNKVALFTIANGKLSPAGSVATGSTPRGVAVAPNDSFVYVVNQGAGTVSQYIRIGSTLTPMPTATVSAGSQPVAIALSPDGRYAYVANAGDDTLSQYSIGPGGALVPLATAAVSSGGAQPGALIVR